MMPDKLLKLVATAVPPGRVGAVDAGQADGRGYPSSHPRTVQ
jgi:hypothetical protein